MKKIFGVVLLAVVGCAAQSSSTEPEEKTDSVESAYAVSCGAEQSAGLVLKIMDWAPPGGSAVMKTSCAVESGRCSCSR